jgi:hypothetical protein
LTKKIPTLWVGTFEILVRLGQCSARPDLCERKKEKAVKIKSGCAMDGTLHDENYHLTVS